MVLHLTSAHHSRIAINFLGSFHSNLEQIINRGSEKSANQHMKRPYQFLLIGLLGKRGMIFYD